MIHDISDWDKAIQGKLYIVSKSEKKKHALRLKDTAA